MHTQSTLLDDYTQAQDEKRPPQYRQGCFEPVSTILKRTLHELSQQWEFERNRRATLESALDGPFRDDLSLLLDACLANEERLSTHIAAWTKEWEAHQC